MTKTTLNPPTIWTPKGSYSQVVMIKPGRLVFLAGQTAVNRQGELVGPGDIRAQTKQVLQNIKNGIEAAGGTLQDIVSMTVFITDARYHSDVNEVRGEIFGSSFPVSAMVEVAGLARPEMLIEISDRCPSGIA